MLATIGLGTFMSALDGSVVNTLLPVLSRALRADVAEIEWVATVYLLVVSVLLLPVGRLGDLRGHKRTYLAGFGLFVLGSALCGLAPAAGWLIACRGLQAIGATMLFANAPAILTRSFPSSERGRALGSLGTFTYLGLTTGPALGGWLADTLGWRSVFYLNLPLGLAAIAVAGRTISDDRPETAGQAFDLPGAALFCLGLLALLVALNQGHAWGWGSVRIAALAAAAAAALATFLAVERRRPSPMLDFDLFRNRIFAGATVSALLNYICVNSVTFVLPFLLIRGRGLSPRHAGLVLSAQPLIMAAVAPLSGSLSDRIGSRAPATVGMTLLTAGLALLAAAGSGSLAPIAGALAVVGLGVGIFVSPNNSALMGAAPRDRQGTAAGVLATARNVGMVLGVGLSGAIFTTVLAHAAPHSALGREALPSALDQGTSPSAPGQGASPSAPAQAAPEATAIARGVRASLLAAVLVGIAGAVSAWMR